MQKHLSSSKSFYLLVPQHICHSFSLAIHKTLVCGFYNFNTVNSRALNKALGIIVSNEKKNKIMKIKTLHFLNDCIKRCGITQSTR